MTDLTKALAELRRVTPPNSPWEAGDLGVGSSQVDYHIATILNAVLSGDLIHRADADLAMATPKPEDDLRLLHTEAAEAELSTLRAQVERLTGALTGIADFTEKPGHEFAKLHPKLNAALDAVPQDRWAEVLSEFTIATLTQKEPKP